MTFRALLVAFLSVTLQAQAGDSQRLDKSLTDKYVGMLFTVRGFYKQDVLEYDSAGEPRFKGEPGPWTLYGKLEVTGLKVRKGKLEVEGNRVWVTWVADGKGDRQMELLRSQERVVIRADLTSPVADPAEVDRLMPRIFLTQSDRMSDLVPTFWRRFLAGAPAGVSSGAAPSKPKKPKSGEFFTKLNSGEFLVGGKRLPGVTGGDLRKRVAPVYSKEAKSAHLEGALVFDAVIDTQGRLRDVSVVEPLGLGTEESAVEALEQWLYQPYLLDGKPVEVATRIAINFRASPR